MNWGIEGKEISFHSQNSIQLPGEKNNEAIDKSIYLKKTSALTNFNFKKVPKEMH